MFVIAVIGAFLSAFVASGAAIAGGPGHSGMSAANGVVSCHPSVSTAHVESPGDTAPRHHVDCPDCCRIPTSASAVLPGRTGLAGEPAAYWSHIRFVSLACGEPETSAPSTVNGARAPPCAV